MSSFELPDMKTVWQKTDELIKQNAPIKEINCIPNKKWKLRKDLKTTFCGHYPNKPEDYKSYPVIMVWNEYFKSYRPEPLIEYKEACPVCLKTLMLVRAVAGTTWLACCCEDCYKKYRKWKEETFDKKFSVPTISLKDLDRSKKK